MKKILISAATAMLLASTAFAAEEPREPDLGRTFPVAGNVHIALFENRNSVFLVDDERILLSETNFERNAENLRNIIATVSPAPVELIINTHWHGDHIGGNKFFHEHGAVTLSHENTRIRMSEDQVNPVTNQVQLPAQAPEFLPMVTVKDGAVIHWGDETVEIVHYPDAHTDSDLVLYYDNSNVIFAGGLLEYPAYAGVYDPEGFVAALDAVIARADENTKVIPWQGPVVGRAELQEWRDIIETVAANVSALIAEGKTIDEIIAAKPSGQYDEKWGGGRTPERFARDMHYVLTHGTRD